MRLGADPRLGDAVDVWLRHLDATKAMAAATRAAYRRDVEGIAARIAGPKGSAGLRVHDLDKRSLRAGFASWADDHAATSVLRAHSAWSRFFDFLVAQDIRDGNPMGAVPRPQKPREVPRSIRHPDAAARLLAAAAVADPQARVPWPERDLVLIATFCVTGIRVGEAVDLGVSSLQGPRPARYLVVVGKTTGARAIPVHDPLETALQTYLHTRAARFPHHNLDHPSTALFVDTRGRRLSADQIKYLIERLYVRAGLRARVPRGALVHALRHTFASSAVKAGADIIELQALLGHSSLETTRRYIEAVPPASA